MVDFDVGFYQALLEDFALGLLWRLIGIFEWLGCSCHSQYQLGLVRLRLRGRKVGEHVAAPESFGFGLKYVGICHGRKMLGQLHRRYTEWIRWPYCTFHASSFFFHPAQGCRFREDI